jgi:hypothetical protein
MLKCGDQGAGQNGSLFGSLKCVSIRTPDRSQTIEDVQAHAATINQRLLVASVQAGCMQQKSERFNMTQWQILQLDRGHLLNSV